MKRVLTMCLTACLVALTAYGRKESPAKPVLPVSFEAPTGWMLDSDKSRGMRYSNPQNSSESFRLVLLQRTNPPRMTEKRIQEDLREISQTGNVQLELLTNRRYFSEDSAELEQEGQKLYRHRYYLVQREATASAWIAVVVYTIPLESAQTKDAVETRALVRSKLRDATFQSDR